MPTTFTCDAPLAADDPVLDQALKQATTSAALRDIISMRLEQVTKHGHTPDKDAQLPVRYLAAEAHRRMGDALENLNDHAPVQRLVLSRNRMIRAAAVLIAAADRIDIAILKTEEPLP